MSVEHRDRSVSPNVITTTDYTYDNNGNLYSKSKRTENSSDSQGPILSLKVLGTDAEPEDASVYEYNLFNQLVRVSQGDKIIENTYNADGLRVSQSINGEVSRFAYEDGNVIFETDAQGNQTARNVHGIRMISRTADGQDYLYRYNGHGDVTVVTDAAGGEAVLSQDKGTVLLS